MNFVSLKKIIVFGLSFSAFPALWAQEKTAADKIFYNGTILTIDPKNSITEAVAVHAGKIVAVGSRNEVWKTRGNSTELIDLHHKTLLPGFIDGHSHFGTLGFIDYVNIASPPVGTVHRISDIIALLKKSQQEKHISKGQLILAFGYDPDLLEEKRHPNTRDLDAAFPDNPVVLIHTSGHMQVANSYALRASGIIDTTKDPANGKIVRYPGTNTPNGLLQESAANLLKFANFLDDKAKADALETKLKQIDELQQLYASNGITTAQEGFTSLPILKLLQSAASKGRLYLDVESLVGYPFLNAALKDSSVVFGVLRNHLKIAGSKIIADGSPQGKTAYFTQPYLTEVPGCTGDDCRGIATVSQQQLNEAIVHIFRQGIQPYVHCNGDAAIDLYLHAVRFADSTLHTVSIDKRPVVIHSQFVRKDQLDDYKTLGLLPSFFTNHAFFWGDVHIRNLGQQRAFYLSPLKDAVRRNISFTNHSDWPVTPLNPLFILWTSVARESRSGVVVGPDQRISVTEGLRALTINGAYQYFEEKTKGSIEPGKLADFVILSENPLNVKTDKIKDIKILETIKEGKTIYKK